MANEQVSIDILINTAESTKSLTELRQVTKQLQDQLKQTGLGAADINKIETALSGTRERVEDINAAINAGKDGGIQGFASLGRNIAGSFGVATGALGLFGSKNEELNAIINKVNASVALLSGVQAAADAVRDAGILKGLVLSKAKIVSTEAETVAVGKATLAQRAWNLVLSANPIALVITAVVALVAAVKIFGDTTEETTEKVLTENEALKAQQDILNDSLAEYNTYSQNKINLLKAQGASEEVLYTAERQRLLDEKRILQERIDIQKTNTREQQKENDRLVNERAKVDIKIQALDAAEVTRKDKLRKDEIEKDKKQFQEQAKLRLDAQESLKKYYETLIGLNNALPSNSPLTRALIAIREEQDKLSTSASEAYAKVVNSANTTAQEQLKAQAFYYEKIDELANNATAKREKAIQDYTLEFNLETEKKRLDFAKQRGEDTIELEIDILKRQYEIQLKNLAGPETELVEERKRLAGEYFGTLFILYEQEQKTIDRVFNENLSKQDQFLTSRVQLNTDAYNKEQALLEKSLAAGITYLDAQITADKTYTEQGEKDIAALQAKYNSAKTASTLTYLQESKAIIQKFRDEEVNYDRSALEKQLVNQRSNEQSRLNSIQEYAEKRQAIILADITLSSTAKEIASAELVTEVENLKTAAVTKGVAERTQIIASEVSNQVQQYGQLASSVVSAISAVGESQRAIAQNNYDYEAQIRDQNFNDLNDSINASYSAKVNAANGDKDLLEQANEDRNKALAKAARDKAIKDREELAKQDKINEEAFENSKKLQIAQAIIQTAQSATGAFAALAGIPIVGPVLGGIAAGAAVVAGTAQINTIKNTKYVKATLPSIPAEYANSTASSSSGSSSASQQNQFVGGFDFNNSSLFGQAYPFPMSDQRVYVLESDITSTQGRVATIEDRNTF